MSAFDDIDRTDLEPANHVIGKFDYLNVSARPEAGRVRRLIDGWLEVYPGPDRIDLIRRRLRSRDDIMHTSAVFELLLHAMLVRRGHVIIAIEPEMPNGRAPDFLVEAPGGQRYYLEATIASGMDQVAAGGDRRMRETLQAIDEVNSPDFFLQLHHRGTPARPIAIGKLRRSIQLYVDGLDHAEAVRAVEAGQRPSPLWQHDEHGAHFRIEAYPKNTPRAGGRAMGGRMIPGGLIHPEVAIRSAVEGKATRYGELDLPLVIAVNALAEFAGITDAIDALFGTANVVIREDGEARPGRNPDGAWRGPAGPVNTRSSAVLFVERLSAWSVGQRSLRLIVNPWARNPLGDIDFGIERREVIDSRLQSRGGESLGELFELPASWPEAEDD